ncbi:hypothetical protein LJC27_00055 [Christensenellaceae bacterium OttesenSCG-928-M15]|nr:hypothetical protein [Christensenellaceae bacterium OttesenSCG-928-M15]
MTYRISVENVLEALIMQEREGYAFYMEAANSMLDLAAKRMFERLGREKLYHIQKFMGLKAKQLEKQLEMDHETATYVEMLIADFSIPVAKRKKRALKTWNKEGALGMAESTERASIFLLAEILFLDIGLDGEGVLIEAMKEDRNHLSDILQTKFEYVSAHMML